MKTFLINQGFNPIVKGINGFMPAFFIDDIAYFEIKKWWGISRIVQIDEAFKNRKVIGFITDKYYITDHAGITRLADWIAGVQRPLLLLSENHLFRAYLEVNGPKIVFEGVPISPDSIFCNGPFQYVRR